MEFPLITAVYAVLIAFAVHILAERPLIPFLTRMKFGQNVRSDGPQTHLKKTGTPTMGGIAIIAGLAAASVFFLWRNVDGLVLVLTTVGFGLVGFLDDYLKVVKKRSLGLRAYQKILGQLIVSAPLIWYAAHSGNMIFGLNATSLLVPFGRSVDLGRYYVPFAVFVVIAVVNGSNLTDGLDGLAAGVGVRMLAFFIVMAWAAGSGTLPIAGAAAGSLLGFLLFNGHPARIIMGDTGSLALGGFVAGLAILLKMPLFIPIVGFIFFIESLSVVLQVGYFKFSGGKRLFKMAPIHHSFELAGWPETRIVTLFYAVTSVACLVGFLAGRNLI